ncbi:MAG: CRISPR-associated helicase Cas3' [Holophagaceae bacterium]|nr:CRISPR-associated helicase Cas3' [Holophagaceae bacterium]
MNRKPLAHVRQLTDGTWQEHPLAGHLLGTAKRAAAFAEPFKNADWAYQSGLWHDLGKFNPAWQTYLKGKSGYDPEAHLEGVSGKLDHSSAGALHATGHLGPAGRVLAYLIAGHHAGLPDWGHEIGIGGSLSVRLNAVENLAKASEGEISRDLLDPPVLTSRPCVDEQHFHLWIRMLFSCLVDADFLDTEAFMNPEKAEGRGAMIEDLVSLKARFDAYMTVKQGGAADTPVNHVRRDVLAACRAGSGLEPGLFSLTVPTGGGKTLASMAFALEHAVRFNKRRIIVVIPYTSIIEQTAAELRKVFGDAAVLEHHSNLDPEKESPQSRLASENWDAPIIVTTNVQFFESLFASRTSACRKLHNLVDSVVILDEAQMLPPEYLRPILGVLQGLTMNFGVSALLCTATQPALVGRIGSQKAAFQGLERVRELMPNPGELSRSLRRVTLRPQHPELVPVVWKDLAMELSRHDQVLCIVNTRKDCRDLQALMPEGTIHLSALMCAEHRSDVITLIKALLKLGWPIRVISTQLVEAGVDIDFPVVYRAMAGLDSIAQAAGRCNREGKLNESGRLGDVVYFAPPKPAPPGLLRKGEEAGHEMLRCFPELVANLDPEAFKHYFECFFGRVNSFDAKDMKGLLEDDAQAGQFQFRTAATRFLLIDDQAQRALLVWYPPQKAEIQRLLEELRSSGPSRVRMRKLQRYTVNISERTFRALQDRGEILEYGGIWAQAVDGLYDPRLGLCPDGSAWNPETYIP